MICPVVAVRPEGANSEHDPCSQLMLASRSIEGHSREHCKGRGDDSAHGCLVVKTPTLPQGGVFILVSSYSMTSSARARSMGGTSSPRAFAVFS
jgi:hypothetical protein